MCSLLVCTCTAQLADLNVLQDPLGEVGEVLFVLAQLGGVVFTDTEEHSEYVSQVRQGGLVRLYGRQGTLTNW